MSPTAQHALLFDYDGLIVDTETTILRVLIEIMASDGHHFELDEFGHLLGTTDNDDAWREFLSARIGPYDDAELERKIGTLVRPLIDALEPLPGVVDLLQAARDDGWRTGIATGNARHRVIEWLQTVDLARSFDEIVTSAEVSRGKPAPDVYLELTRRLDVAPENCVALEDSALGCRAAIAAGMSVILCPCEATRACEFPSGVQHVQSLEDVDFETLVTRASAPPRR